MQVLNENSKAQIGEFIERHLSHLEAIEDSLARDEGPDHRYMRRKWMVPLDASGNGTVQAQVPFGFDWVLQRITVTSTGNGVCQLFIDTTAMSDLVEEIGSSQVYSDAFNNNIFIPGGSQLFIVFTGAGANGQATVNLQIEVIGKPVHKQNLENYEIGSS